ncbi:hypothetical protein Fleli_3495 [Bernardetia litoralis DSM 6794]|uniref:WGR domain-containing protein n=1 Tax=Bernardetia litoralis (strain ATCC 23117 / DSM 6794 / NBRC 15988 / NCIMB 1366 / Fx l1 / Sio-4) TaxID=880071 RepID=I4APD0_BERLS|nr:hypothetical protein [Bernardetia litoralis]AFM05815.1 hypothetical protein Fleli_3495 [Bernardetia litoralis DSM 6794]
MKLIEQSKLFFKKGNSDKVYEIDLCEVGDDLYVVNFRYGKRGAKLKEGTKTASSVGRTKAQAVFTALETEKTKKGYKKEKGSEPKKEKVFPTSIASKEEAILQRLKEALNKVNHPKEEQKSVFQSKWKTGRIAWKVGKLRLKSAIPFLIELLQKNTTLEQVEIYSILYALVRCKDENGFLILSNYTDEKYPDYVQKIAKEGLLSSEKEKGKVAKNLIESLPPVFQELVESQNGKGLEKEITLRIGEKYKDFQFIETLYLLVHVQPFLQKVILQAFSKIPLRPPFFKYIRSIYKLAEVRDDARLLGLLSYRFEKTMGMYKSTSISENEDTSHWRYSYKVRRYIFEISEQVSDITKEVKKKDSKIGFSEQTREYFQRRDLRRLKDFALDTENDSYVKLATSILLGYQQKDYQAHSMSSLGYASWNRTTRKYTHNFTVFPDNASSLLLNLILNGNNKELELVSNKWRKKEKITIISDSWYAEPAAQEGNLSPLERVKLFNQKTLAEQKEENKIENRNEFFPQKWDALPQAYVQLLAEAKLDSIHEFAYKNFKTHSEYENLVQKFDTKLLKKLLSSSSEIPAFFGVEICKDKLHETFDKELTLILLNSRVEEGRKLAQEIIQKNSEEFTKDTNFTLFVSELIFNQYPDIRNWVNEFLQNIQLSNEKWQIIVAKGISEMLSTDKNYSALLLKDAQNVLKTNAKTVLENLGWNIVLELLENKNLQNQVFASDILLIKSKLIKATDIPFSILSEFFESKSEEIRSNGMEIFANYPESALLEAHQLLGNMLVSPYQNLRVSAGNIVTKLVQNKVNQESKEGKEFAEAIVTGLILALRKKDPEEIKREEAAKNNNAQEETQNELSVHAEIADLLINYFDAYLSKITLKTTLNLLHGNYREGQFVGFHILKNHIASSNNKDGKEEISIRQIVALAAHELLEIRSWTLEYYQNNVPRIRYERDEALQILDAKWEDVRLKAMEFFRENFTEKEWDVDSLVSIADSVRPDIEAFGKELITKFFEEKDGEKYLIMLSQHPSNSMQLFATNYLERFATGNLQHLKEMEFYFRCVLMQVNKGRIAKTRVLEFLEKEALSSKETAFWVVPLFNDLVATSAVQDKERFIQILQKLKTKYDNLKVALVFE